MRTLVVAALTVSAALLAMPVSAQSSVSARPGHGFATVGVVVSTSNDPVVGVSWVDEHLLVNGVLFVAPRVGVGIERLPEHDAEAVAAHNLSFDQSEQVREQSALMITAHGRALTRARLALDGVVGVGRSHQVRSLTTVMRFAPFGTTTTTTETTSAAFSFGADGTISLARHIAVIPQIRWYFRRAGESAPGFGVTAGVSW
jgi:hypothetical protein